MRLNEYRLREILAIKRLWCTVCAIEKKEIQKENYLIEWVQKDVLRFTNPQNAGAVWK